MTMKYDTRQIGDVTIVDVSGRLSLAEEVAFGPGSGVVLGETVRELAKKGHRKILLNLTGVTYVDSSGVGQLVGALTSARNQGGDLKLLNPTPKVLEVLKTTNLHTVFDVRDDEASAIQAFSKGVVAAG